MGWKRAMLTQLAASAKERRNLALRRDSIDEHLKKMQPTHFLISSFSLQQVKSVLTGANVALHLIPYSILIIREAFFSSLSRLHSREAAGGIIDVDQRFIQVAQGGRPLE